MKNVHQILFDGLPPIYEGRVCPKVYHAGYGRYPQFNDGKILSQRTDRTDRESIAYAEHYRKFGADIRWLKQQPDDLEWTAEYGPYRCRVQKRGGNAEVASHTEGPTDAPVTQRLVLDLNHEGFVRYIRQLERSGFELIWENRIEHNHFAELICAGRLIYARHSAKYNEARFINDPLSCRIDRFGSPCPEAGAEPLVCQFGLHYGPPISGVTMNCGMLYIIRLPDRSFALIDGGEYEQATDEAVGEILRLMRSMIGAAEGEKLRISAWFCTHAHDDHMDVFSKLLRFHHDGILLERVIFNFPACGHFELMPETYFMLARLNRYFPDALFLKAHSGQRFSLSGVDFEILQTHEDGPLLEGDEPIGDLNDSSTVMKISFGRSSLLILGDISARAEMHLLRNYTEKTLRAHAVQTAHHLVNRLDALYPVIRPEIALIPSYHYRRIRNEDAYRSLLRVLADENMYFAEDGSYIFAPDANGGFVLRECIPTVGGAYDGSPV